MDQSLYALVKSVKLGRWNHMFVCRFKFFTIFKSLIPRFYKTLEFRGFMCSLQSITQWRIK